MRNCPACGQSFSGDTQFCPDDGTALVATGRDPLVGRVIGERYRLDERLGRGAMGTVYRALHTRMDKPVAVKLLRAELAGDPEAVARFQREARSASRLDHEHCIRVTDFGQSEDGLLYLVMELLDGQSLTMLVDRGPLPTPVAAAIGCDIASALAHAHEHGVIHRDLKPDNVVLARRGRRSSVHTVVKVLDFGLAKIAGETGGASVTRAGSVFGTPEYMAPEQAEGLGPDPRSDLYSLGALLYHLVTGQLPFRATNVIQLLGQHVEEPPEPPRQRRPDLKIPAALEEVILRCLAKRPEYRFPDANAVVAALRPMADPEALDRLMDEAPTLKKPVPPVLAAMKAEAGALPSESLDLAASPSASASASTSASTSTSTSTQVYRAGEGEDGSEIDQVPRSGRRWVVAAVAGVLMTVGVGGVIVSRSSTGKGVVATGALGEGRRLLAEGRLDAAEQVLSAERAAHDGTEVQMLLGDLAHRRGQRLKALAHLHRATRLGPAVVEPHARLASLLREYGQPDAACAEAEVALRIDAGSAAARAAAEPCEPKRR